MAAGVLLLFFTSWTGLFWIAVALGLYELLVTAVAGVGPVARVEGRCSCGRCIRSDGAETGRDRVSCLLLRLGLWCLLLRLDYPGPVPAGGPLVCLR